MRRSFPLLGCALALALVFPVVYAAQGQENQQDRDQIDLGAPPPTDREEAQPQEETRPDQPADEAHHAQPERQGRPSAVLGVTIDPNAAAEAATVMHVSPNSPAAQAGLQPGDQVLRINNEQVASGRRLSDMIAGMEPGKKVEIVIRRGGEEKTLTATLAAPPQMPGFGAPDQRMGQQEPMQQQDRAWLGVFLSEEQAEGQQGVAIIDIFPQGPAARAGLRPGDMILRIGDQDVRDAAQARQILQQKNPNDRVAIVIRRQGQEQTVNPTLASDRMMRQGPMFGGPMGPGMQPGMQPGMRPGMGPGMQSMHGHQDLEQRVQQLTEEIRQLRQEIRELRTAQRPQDNQPR